MGISDFRPPASKKSTAQISREIRDFLDED